MRKIIVLFIMMVLVLGLSSCSLLSKEKEFTVSDLTITLTSRFAEKEVIGFTSTYQSTDVLVFVLEEDKDQLDYGLTLEKYAKLILEVNKLDDVDYEKEDDYICFEYTKNVSGKDYYYYARAYETEDSFWLIQFACFESKQDKLFDDIEKYADSIKFDE